MSELRKLADAKIGAERKKLLASLHDRMETLKVRQSAAGILRSGDTLVKIVSVCSQMLESLRDAVITQYQWALSESLLPTQTFTEELIRASHEHLSSLLSPCIGRLRREGSYISAEPNAITECCTKLEVKKEEVCKDIELALRSRFAELKRNRIRGIWRVATGWISKLAGGPA